jgi:putative ATP-dependent endonuclease of OLD family
MGIMLTNIRIKNFRSLESVDLTLGKTNILIGPNNSGKSNFLRAVDIAFAGFKDVSENDIYIAEGERLDRGKTAIVDILLRPTDGEGNIIKQFSDFWIGVFTADWITIDETTGNYVGIRTIIQYDELRMDYILVRYSISDWNSSIDLATLGKKKLRFTEQMSDTLTSFFMDAQRDIVEDIKNKKSYFGKATSQKDLPAELVADLESRLSDINKEIVAHIPALQATSDRMKSMEKTIGGESSVEIEPLTRRLSDLQRGMDIIFKDGASAEFSISQHGMGTRSWISFLTLAAYVDWQIGNAKKKMKKLKTM